MWQRKALFRILIVKGYNWKEFVDSLVKISMKNFMILLYIIWKDKYTVQEKDRKQDLRGKDIGKGEKRCRFLKNW